jgi:medium-chain acyl-[acyl-carrier-protein] hydrolase
VIAMTGIDTSRTWLPLRATNDNDLTPLFCLPHAGGAASAFRTWLGAVPGARVLPVQLPGREGRMREEPYQRTEPLVEDVAALIIEIAGDRPYAVYGHSLGALTAFETVRELRRRGAPQPTHLIVSGSPAPQKCHEHGRKVSTMPTPKLVRMLRKLGGTPDWLLDDPELLQMILPAVRSDFAMREAYRYRPEPPLDVPITVLASDADPRAPHRSQTKWSAQTSAAFALHTLPGGHFAIFEQADLTRGYLTGAVTSSACR